MGKSYFNVEVHLPESAIYLPKLYADRVEVNHESKIVTFHTSSGRILACFPADSIHCISSDTLPSNQEDEDV